MNHYLLGYLLILIGFVAGWNIRSLFEANHYMPRKLYMIPDDKIMEMTSASFIALSEGRATYDDFVIIHTAYIAALYMSEEGVQLAVQILDTLYPDGIPYNLLEAQNRIFGFSERYV